MKTNSSGRRRKRTEEEEVDGPFKFFDLPRKTSVNVRTAMEQSEDPTTPRLAVILCLCLTVRHNSQILDMIILHNGPSEKRDTGRDVAFINHANCS